MSVRRSCDGPRNGARKGFCVALLAAGAIHDIDMCSPCTASYVTALEWVTGESLPWQEQVRDRAVLPVESGPWWRRGRAS